MRKALLLKENGREGAEAEAAGIGGGGNTWAVSPGGAWSALCRGLEPSRVAARSAQAHLLLRLPYLAA